MPADLLRRVGVALTRFFSALGRTEAHRRRTEIARLARTASENPANDRVLLRLAGCYVRGGDIQRALSAYWHAHELYRAREDYPKSAAVLRRAVTLAPHDPSARVELAGVLERMDRKREAAIQYEQAGWIYKGRGEVAQLLSCFERSLALDPHQKHVAYEIARMRPARPAQEAVLPRIVPFTTEPASTAPVPTIPERPTAPTQVPFAMRIPDAPTETADFLGAATMAFNGDPEETAPSERDSLPPELFDQDATATYQPDDLADLLLSGFPDDTIASEAWHPFDDEHRTA